jgi:sugar O-acyltransferase (sialic acid O-acetyltransferase NeuD family)
MSQKSLILIGAGGHASSCIDVIEQEGQYSVAGMIGMASEVGGSRIGYKVLATDDELHLFAEQFKFALVAIGQIASPTQRIRLYQMARSLGFQLPTIISPKAYVSPHAVLGDGTMVMPGAIVNASARIGSNCIINSRALIEHDAVVADHCHISTGAIVNGSAQVGTGSFLGSGAILRDGRKIGAHCVIGMGLQVRHDQVDNTHLRNR